ncbi:hypothetical protein [Streptomyces sp. NPDC018059]|uniref:hypothetical protein n=1 Tax=Streptomyces sp. NPDC018059 TaxID=3365041 RepID=UPI00379379D1
MAAPTPIDARNQLANDPPAAWAMWVRRATRSLHAQEEPPGTPDIAPPSAAASRERRAVPSTGSPTLDCARAAHLPAHAPSVRSLIESMRNTEPPYGL